MALEEVLVLLALFVLFVLFLLCVKSGWAVALEDLGGSYQVGEDF